MYPVTIEFDKPLWELFNLLMPLGNASDPIEIAVTTVSGNVSCILNSIGRAEVVRKKKGVDSEITGEDILNVLQWGALAIIKTLQVKGVSVSGLSAIAEGSRYDENSKEGRLCPKWGTSVKKVLQSCRITYYGRDGLVYSVVCPCDSRLTEFGSWEWPFPNEKGNSLAFGLVESLMQSEDCPLRFREDGIYRVTIAEV